MDKVIILNDRDNVATCLADFRAGETIAVAGCQLTLPQGVAFGHKIALADITAGDDIVKYGEVIGVASADIAAGAHVHVHNVESRRARGDKPGARGDGERS